MNSIHPGIIETAMVDEFSRKGINESVRERIPMGHYADASEVANLALFLASDESSYCSGSEFVIDGAMTAWSRRFSTAFGLGSMRTRR